MFCYSLLLGGQQKICNSQNGMNFHIGDLFVKNIYLLDGLSGHPDAFVTFNDYPPAASLFEFLFTFFSHQFNEGSIYLGLYVLCFTLQIQLFVNVKWKNIYKIILNTLLILILPTVFMKEFYTIIYVDALLGILFAYILISYFFIEENKLGLLNIGLSFFILVLTKPSGLGLAGIAFLIIVADVLLNKYKKNLKLKNNYWVQLLGRFLYSVL